MQATMLFYLMLPDKKTLLTVVASTTLVVHAIAQDAIVKDFQFTAFKKFKPLEKDGWVKEGTFILNINQAALRD